MARARIAFAQAAGQFQEILNANPSDQPAQLFIKKTGNYLAVGVPDAWSGVEEMVDMMGNFFI